MRHPRHFNGFCLAVLALAAAVSVAGAPQARAGGPPPPPPPQLIVGGGVSVDGGVEADAFSGDGSALTSLSPGNIGGGTAAIDITGNAATATTAGTATSLVTNPTDCAAGLFATAIDASGNLTCAPIPGGTGGRTVTVVATGTAGENCTALKAALSGIGDSSAANPYLVRVGPGVYSCGVTGTIVVPPFTTLEGAGIDATTIEGTAILGLIDLEDGSELRFLTAINECTGSPSFCPTVEIDAVSAVADITATLTHVRVLALPGCTDSNCGSAIQTVPQNFDASLVVEHSYIEGSRHAYGCNAYVGDGEGYLTGIGSQFVSTSDESLIFFCGGPPFDFQTCVNSFDEDFDPLTKTCVPAP